ncbi:MAG: histidine kinase [Nocardioides sp.]
MTAVPLTGVAALTVALVLVGASAAVAGQVRIAVLAAVAALAWPGTALAGSDAAAYAIALALGWTAEPVAVVLVLVSIRVDPRTTRLLALGAAAIGACGLLATTTYSAFDDPGCHVSCLPNPLLVRDAPGVADAAHTTGAMLALLVWLTLLVFAGREARHRPPWPAVCAVLTCAVFATVAVLGLRTSRPSLAAPVWSDYGWRMAAGGLVVLLVAVTTATTMLVRRRLRGLGRALVGDDPQPAVDQLRAALGDPTVELAYWEDGTYLDLAGSPLPRPRHGRRRTELRSHGEPLAVVDHDARLSPALLVKRLGSSARMAIHNDGLAWQLEREVTALAESRRRVVETADDERARMERDLHDGAQQHILGLAFELVRASGDARGAGDVSRADDLDRAQATTQDLLDRLRGVAHGIHPAVLDTGGLVAALRRLSDRSSAPFVVTGAEPWGVAGDADRTVYAIARDCSALGLTEIAISRGDSLTVLLTMTEPLPGSVRDRVVASEGSWSAGPGGWVVVLPCA